MKLKTKTESEPTTTLTAPATALASAPPPATRLKNDTFLPCSLCHKPANPVQGKVRRRHAKGWKKFINGITLCDTCAGEFVRRTQGFQLYLIEEDKDKRQAAYRHIKDVQRAASWCHQFIFRALWKSDASPIHPELTEPAISKTTGKPYLKHGILPKFDEAVPAARVNEIYRMAYAAFPELGSNTVSSIWQTVVKKYKKVRYAINYSCQERIPEYNVGQPIPIAVRDYEFSWLNETDRVPVITIKLGTIRLRFRVRLGKHGSSSLKVLKTYLEQLDALAKNGHTTEIVYPGTEQLKFLFDRTNHHDNRPVIKVKDKDGKPITSRLGARIGFWMPRHRAVTDRSRVMVIQTSPHCLFEWSISQHRFNRLPDNALRQALAAHGAQLKKELSRQMYERKTLNRIRRHRARMQGFSDNKRAILKGSQANIVHPREVASESMSDFMITLAYRYAEGFCKLAVKLKCGQVAIVPSAKNSISDRLRFPYADLAKRLADDLDKCGILCVRDTAAEKADQLLAAQEKAIQPWLDKEREEDKAARRKGEATEQEAITEDEDEA